MLYLKKKNHSLSVPVGNKNGPGTLATDLLEGGKNVIIFLPKRTFPGMVTVEDKWGISTVLRPR